MKSRKGFGSTSERTESAERGKDYKMRKAEHDEYCKRIAEKLKEIVLGHKYTCPYCGNQYDEPQKDDLCECGEYLEPMSVYDYFRDALDIEYRVNGKHADEINSVKIMITCGGPNVYVDTEEKKVLLYWWNENGEAWLDDDVVEAVNEFANEIWNC